MAQNEPERKDRPPGPSPNSPSLLFEYQCRSGKFIRLANQIETFLPELECSTMQLVTSSDYIRNPKDFTNHRSRFKLQKSLLVGFILLTVYNFCTLGNDSENA